MVEGVGAWGGPLPPGGKMFTVIKDKETAPGGIKVRADGLLLLL
jgi:hypothetical protein